MMYVITSTRVIRSGSGADMFTKFSRTDQVPTFYVNAASKTEAMNKAIDIIGGNLEETDIIEEVHTDVVEADCEFAEPEIR